MIYGGISAKYPFKHRSGNILRNVRDVRENDRIIVADTGA
jgi:hypothetical protein